MSRTRAIDRFIGDTFGAGSRFAVRCGNDRCANQSRATASNSCNGWPAAAYNLGAGGWCCMLAAAGSQSQHLFGISSVKHHDVEANCMIWLDRSVSLSENFKYFNSVVSSVAFLGNGNGAICNSRPFFGCLFSRNLLWFELFYWRQGATWSCQVGRGISECRGLMRMVAGPPAHTCWALLWRDILQGWNLEQWSTNAVGPPCWKRWSAICQKKLWNFLTMLQPCRRNGGPAGCWRWTSKDRGDLPTLGTLEKYSFWKEFDDLIVEAPANDHRM